MMMTDAEWSASGDPFRMLKEIPGWNGHRPMRLFACAVVRSRWATLADYPESRSSVEQAELIADDVPVGPKRLILPMPHSRVASTEGVWAGARLLTAVWVGRDEVELLLSRGARGEDPLDLSHCAGLLRDIVGPPSSPLPTRLHPVAERSAARPPSWLTQDVMNLARAAYEERPYEDGLLDPVNLMVLSDALEEAGCEGTSRECMGCGGHGTLMQAAPDRGPAPTCDYCGGTGIQRWPHPLLAHLRSPGPHVRGCRWLDLLLDR